MKNRVNIVLTRDKNYRVKDAIVVHSVEEALEEVKNIRKTFTLSAGTAFINRCCLTATRLM